MKERGSGTGNDVFTWGWSRRIGGAEAVRLPHTDYTPWVLDP